MRLLQLADELRYQRMSSEELRSSFLIDSLFTPGTIELVYVDLDRTVVGSAVPLDSPLPLPCPDLFRAASFTERRELAIFNIGAPGSVLVGGETYELGNREALYIGRGNRAISFLSADSSAPAEFYLLSYPAHAEHPVAPVQGDRLIPTTIGDPSTASHRSIYKLIHMDGIASCQLVMGFTTLHKGSVWNTMPPHTHTRRSEVYLYVRSAERSAGRSPDGAGQADPSSDSCEQASHYLAFVVDSCGSGDGQLLLLLGYGWRESGIHRHGSDQDCGSALTSYQ
jgi:4-deoxy-L-threo-5-hexosulose-uronate ketol-isomerase